MRHYLALLVFAALCTPVLAQGTPSLPPPPAQSINPIEGIWVTEQKTEITVAPCAAGLCGVMSKIVIPEDSYQANKAQIDAIGIENLTDVNNSDPALKSRTLLGLPLLTLDKKISPGIYEGEIYSPRDGNTYFGRLELVDTNTVRLTGCAFVVLCQSQDWTRAPEIEAPAPDLHYAQLPPPDAQP